MSHVAVRMLADRLADESEGVNVVSAVVPRFSGAAVPPPVTVYDETRHGWVARGTVPRGEDGDAERISFPCIVVYLQQGSYESGVARSHDGGRFVEGTLTLIAQLIMHEADTELAASHGMYLLRAMRWVILRFDDPEVTTKDERTKCATWLKPATSVSQGQVKAFNEDFVVSPGAIVISQPFFEGVPIT